MGWITGTVPILAVWFFCMGATIDLRATGVVLRKSGTLLVTKVIVAWLATLIASKFLPDGGITTGLLAGLSVLAITASMDMTNGGLYAAVMQQYGTKEEASAFVLMSVESGPLFSMLILGAAGVAVFEPRLFVGAVLPFLIGFALGNLDSELQGVLWPLCPSADSVLRFRARVRHRSQCHRHQRAGGCAARTGRDCGHRHSADPR